MKNATLIYNPISGAQPARREKIIQKISTVLASKGFDVTPLATSGPGTARKLAREAAGQGEGLVIVCGGDGTINETINGMTPGQGTLGVLPAGTANVFAREMGLPRNPLRAAHALHQWSPRRIALGKATWWEGGLPETPKQLERYFLSVAGIGFDAAVIQDLSPRLKTSLGAMGYALTVVREILRYSYPVFVCKTKDREYRATFAVLQRAMRYAGWLDLDPSASIFSDRLGLCVFKSRNRARYILYAAAVLARQHLRLRDVELGRDRKIDCAAAEPGTSIWFELDGELVGRIPASFEVVPDALTVLLPKR